MNQPVATDQYSNWCRRIPVEGWALLVDPCLIQLAASLKECRAVAAS